MGQLSPACKQPVVSERSTLVRPDSSGSDSVSTFSHTTVRQRIPRKGTVKGKSKPQNQKKRLDKSLRPSQRIVVIGDLHGMLDKLIALWHCLEQQLGKKNLQAALVVFLGDYVDRGTQTKDLLTWLVELQKRRRVHGGRTVFLLGNHEFCLLSFLGKLPLPADDPEFKFRSTWEQDTWKMHRGEKERWWAPQGMDDERSWVTEDVLDSMHLQGRRWAGSWYGRSYGSGATFTAYHADMGDRQALLQNMPTEHQHFLVSCSWVHVENHSLLGRLIFVHAGLQADGTEDCEAQIRRLEARDARHHQPEPLFGRDSVLHTPPQVSRLGATVISGHHGRVQLKPHRIILDSCSGDLRNPLAALVLPEMLVVNHDGSIDARDPNIVFEIPHSERGKPFHSMDSQPLPTGDRAPLAE